MIPCLPFWKPRTAYERWEMLESVQGMVGMNRRINRNLENIIFYDEDGNLIFALGNVFLDKPELELNEMLNFSGRMWDEATKQACFEVGLPIYKEETDGYTLLGSAYLLFNVGNLQEIMDRGAVKPGFGHCNCGRQWKGHRQSRAVGRLLRGFETALEVKKGLSTRIT